MNPWFISHMVPETLTTIGVPLNVFTRNSISTRTFTSSSLATRKTFNRGMSWGWDCKNTRTGGWAMLRQYIDPNFVARAAHELGHAFGLWHNFNDGAYIMSYGPGKSQAIRAQRRAIWPYTPISILIVQRRRFLRASCQRVRFFRRVHIGQGATSVPIQLELSHPDGLQQVSLFVTTPETHFSAGSPELKTGRLLEGVTSAIVDFEYDGIIPSDRDHTNLSTLLTHRMEFEVVDMLGNIGKIGLSLLHNSTHKTLSSLWTGEREYGAYGVAFSPDGKVLASGSENQTVELWNAETGEHIATLSGYEGRGYHRRVYSVAFSPDGTILAHGNMGRHDQAMGCGNKNRDHHLRAWR